MMEIPDSTRKLPDGTTKPLKQKQKNESPIQFFMLEKTRSGCASNRGP